MDYDWLIKPYTLLYTSMLNEEPEWRPEKGQWEQIKIHQVNLTYVPNQPQSTHMRKGSEEEKMGKTEQQWIKEQQAPD